MAFIVPGENIRGHKTLYLPLALCFPNIKLGNSNYTIQKSKEKDNSESFILIKNFIAGKFLGENSNFIRPINTLHKKIKLLGVFVNF